MKEHSLSPAHVRNVLIRGTNWAGDTIISLPAAREIRRIMSGVRITFWVPENLRSLLTRAAVCDDIITIPAKQGNPFTRSLRMRNKLAAHSFDLVVLFQNAFESAFTSWLARIPFRAGYPTDLRGPLLNLKIPFPVDIRIKHQAFYYLGIADYMESLWEGKAPDRRVIPEFRIPFDQSDSETALELIGTLGGGVSKPWFCLCPGSANSEAKRWPGDYFARLADILNKRLDAQIIFCGAPSEVALIDNIMSLQKHSGSINLAGRTDMIGMMRVMSLAQIVVSNDTGSAHLAAAASAKVLTLFGPTSPGATAPLGTSSYTMQGTAPCAPCTHFKCPKSEHPCMRGLTPTMVFNRIDWLLTREGSCSQPPLQA